MPLSFSKQKKILQKKKSSELTPVKIHTEEIDEQNVVTVIVPKFTDKFSKKYIVPKLKNKSFRITLDKFGSFVWLNINGTNSAADLIRLGINQFGDEIQPAQERIGKFLFQLFEKKLITFSELNQ